MKDLIITALDNAKAKVDTTIPSTKKSSESIDISDVNPIDLLAFMKKNNIPDNAYFDGSDNGYDGWYTGITLLTWDIDIPTTDKDKLDITRTRFNNSSFRLVYDILTTNGYKRIGFDSRKLKDFYDITAYDMYMDKDFDRLVTYYSLFFTKDYYICL
jgi:hypothetical protein